MSSKAYCELKWIPFSYRQPEEEDGGETGRIALRGMYGHVWCVQWHQVREQADPDTGDAAPFAWLPFDVFHKAISDE